MDIYHEDSEFSPSDETMTKPALGCVDVDNLSSTISK